MTEWRLIELGKLAQIKGGKRLPKGKQLSEQQNSHPYIRTTDISHHKIKISGLLFVPDEIFPSIKNYTVESDDIIISIVGTIGSCAIIPKQLHLASLTENCAKIVNINKQLLNKSYLYFYLISDEGQAEINCRNVGSTQPKLPLYHIQGIPIPCPPIHEQKAIAAILCSLDDKIDLLHRQNKTLEGMAETLFRQWFVEEAEKDWSIVELGLFVSCFNGVSYKSEDLAPSSIAMVTLKSFERDGTFRLDGFKGFIGKYKASHVVAEGDLVVAHTDITQDAALIGNPVLVVSDPLYDKLVISMDLVKVISNHDWLSNEFLYAMMRTRDFKQHCLGYSNGSTVLHLNKQAIPSYKFLLPPNKKIEEFTRLAKDLLCKKFENIAQIRILERLRDGLLPKLMSGDVRVHDG